MSRSCSILAELKVAGEAGLAGRVMSTAAFLAAQLCVLELTADEMGRRWDLLARDERVFGAVVPAAHAALLEPSGEVVRFADEAGWFRGYRAYEAPRAPRGRDGGTRYFGAANFRVDGTRVTALFQHLPPGETSRPHYHLTPELYFCLAGSLRIAEVAMDGTAERVVELSGDQLACVPPRTLHPVRGLAEEGTWNLVWCARSRRKGDGVLRNHFWKDSAPEAAARAIELVGGG